MIAVIPVVMMNYTLTDVTGINMMLTRVVECVDAVGVARLCVAQNLELNLQKCVMDDYQMTM